jgi:hypothetical protein
VIVVAVATVGFAEACLAGGILFVLQIVLQIKLVVHTQEAGLLQMVVTRFFAQEVLVEQFVMATLVIASNLMGVR